MRTSLLSPLVLTLSVGLFTGCGTAAEGVEPGPTPDAADTAAADTATDGGSDTTTTSPPDSTGVDGDTGAADSGSTEAGPSPEDCTAKPDGTVCGLFGSICVAGVCQPTRCGDDYVDRTGGEECDDANDISGDGCTNCKFDCKEDKACDDGDVCSGKETCDVPNHLCKAGTFAVDGTGCALKDFTPGKCVTGKCVKAGCGNKLVDKGEDCDDGNKVDNDGCNTDCTFSCKANADCDDGDKCNGTETCDLVKHTCVSGLPLVCNDRRDCTVDKCDPKLGCTYISPDADKDGKTLCDGDCNDADPSIYPGALECNDGKDNDCNPATLDATAPACSCFADSDGDGYAKVGASKVAATSALCPAGYTNRDPALVGAADCADIVKTAYPGELSYFTTPYCNGKQFCTLGGSCTCSVRTSFDYNCDGVETQRYTAAYSACTFIPGFCEDPKFAPICRKPICTGSGWKGTVPACGVAGTYVSCSLNLTATGCTTTSDPARIQDCK